MAAAHDDFLLKMTHGPTEKNEPCHFAGHFRFENDHKNYTRRIKTQQEHTDEPPPTLPHPPPTLVFFTK